jgi:hypothetical protein
MKGRHGGSLKAGPSIAPRGRDTARSGARRSWQVESRGATAGGLDVSEEEAEGVGAVRGRSELPPTCPPSERLPQLRFRGGLSQIHPAASPDRHTKNACAATGSESQLPARQRVVYEAVRPWTLTLAPKSGCLTHLRVPGLRAWRSSVLAPSREPSNISAPALRSSRWDRQRSAPPQSRGRGRRNGWRGRMYSYHPATSYRTTA